MNMEDNQEVLIIGGGMAGVLTAYLLAKEGVEVTLREKNKLGSGATGDTTAMLTRELDTTEKDLVRMFGRATTKKIYDSHTRAIDEIENIVREEKIACGFMRCPLHRYEVKNAYHITDTLPNQAKFFASKFLPALAKKAKSYGARIMEHSNIRKVPKTGKTIIMTYRPLGNPIQTFMKKGMYTTYVMEVTNLGKKFPEAIYQDDENPYHYFRIDLSAQAGGDTIIIGGEDHREELPVNPKKHFAHLEEHIQKILGHKNYKIKSRWTGPILEPSDGLALIGELKPNQFVATAFSGNGMTYSMIAAMMARDWVLGRKNEWTKLYDPTRIPSPKQLAIKAKDYIIENIHSIT